MFLSTNAVLGLARKLCICFSNSRMGDVLADIKTANKYKDDINKYVNRPPANSKHNHE